MMFVREEIGFELGGFCFFFARRVRPICGDGTEAAGESGGEKLCPSPTSGILPAQPSTFHFHRNHNFSFNQVTGRLG